MHRKAAEVFPFLEAYIQKREVQIVELEQVIERYEKRRQMEERAFQSMSSLRRMLTGKKPDHHLAVEYIHYVKKPMESIRALRLEIETTKQLMEAKKSDDLIDLAEWMEKEISLGS